MVDLNQLYGMVFESDSLMRLDAETKKKVIDRIIELRDEKTF